jgi:hypothetical protein
MRRSPSVFARDGVAAHQDDEEESTCRREKLVGLHAVVVNKASTVT